MTPRLWGRASSVNVQKVMWALAELGIEHERIDAGWTYGQTDTDEFAAMNPNRRVPVWQEEGLTLWESHAIIRHLLSQHRDDVAFGPIADQWMEFTTSTLQPPLIGVFWQCVRTPETERSAQLMARHANSLNAALGILEGRLSETDWLDGSSISGAELAAGSLMFRVFDLDWPKGEFPAVEAWYGRLSEREAYRDTVIVSYEELRV